MTVTKHAAPAEGRDSSRLGMEATLQPVRPGGLLPTRSRVRCKPAPSALPWLAA